MDTPFYKIVKNQASREATIYLYGIIGGYNWETGKYENTADKFVEEFNAIEKDVDTIHVRINSPGGYVFEGLAIVNALYNSEKEIITYNDGLAASMGFVILLAGDKVKGTKNSLVMCHNSSSIYFGNKKEVEEQLEAAEKIDSVLSEIIQEKLGLDEATVFEKYLNYKDNWFTAKEAKEEGFYDEILTKQKANSVPKNVIQMNTNELLQKYAAMTFDIPNPKIPKPMDATNFPFLQRALNIEQPLAVNDDGSFLNLDQQQLIEDAFAQADQKLTEANTKATNAENALNTQKEKLGGEIKVAEQATKDTVDLLRTAALAAGVEGLAEDADATAISEALNAKIAELNNNPGDGHTRTGQEPEPENNYPYLDLESSIYQQN